MRLHDITLTRDPTPPPPNHGFGKHGLHYTRNVVLIVSKTSVVLDFVQLMLTKILFIRKENRLSFVQKDVPYSIGIYLLLLLVLEPFLLDVDHYKSRITGN